MKPYSEHAEKAVDLRPLRSDAAEPLHSSQRMLVDLHAEDTALLLDELNHRIRNLLAMIEAAVRQTQSPNVEDYRAKLMARISGLRGLFEVIGRSDGSIVALAELIEQTMRPFCANGARVLAAGPNVHLDARLALALHLAFHVLATNAQKYGALSSRFGAVRIGWHIRQVSGAARKLAIVWSEHGGPEVKQPRHRGFGARFITRALEGYGEVQLDFNATGVGCYMLIDVDSRSQSCA
jgi:two-component sensor histidine kinase